MRTKPTLIPQSNPLFKGMMLAALGLAGSCTFAAPATTDGAPISGEVMILHDKHSKKQTLIVHDPEATISRADIKGNRQNQQMVLRNVVVVRTTEIDRLKDLVASIPSEFGEVVLVGNLGNRNDAWELKAQDVRSAVAVAEWISLDDSVRTAFVDSGISNDRTKFNEAYRQSMGQQKNARLNSFGYLSQNAPGIQPNDPKVDPAGVSDPDFGLMWHFRNTKPIYLNRDNYITQDIYDTMGITGAGVTVGIVRPGYVEHLDFDHVDLSTNYDAVLTMPVDTSLFSADRSMTAMAGIVSGERGNAFNGHGIAPGARFAGLSRGTGLLDANMYTHELDNIDIKVIPSLAGNEFTDPGAVSNYNEGMGEDYVGDYFRNSLKFGRNRRGAIFVFSSGFTDTFVPPYGRTDRIYPYPDPYDSDKSGIGGLDLSDHGGIDEITIGKQLTIITEDDGGDWETDGAYGGAEPYYGPRYITAQTWMYPFASNRLTFLINGVSEDGNADTNQAIGPSVFASVYSGTSNVDTYWDNALGVNAPRGIFSTVPGGLTDDLPNPTEDWFAVENQFYDVLEVNGSSAAVAGGIIALMLDANPNLTIRGIQHILFESIYDRPYADRASNIRFPNFDPVRRYMDSTASVGQAGNSGFSFWQINSALRDTPNGPMAIRHSDQYGFGVIDAELAVTKAAMWPGTPKLFVLDTGPRDQDAGTEDFPEDRVPLLIPDAEWAEVSDTSTILNPGTFAQLNICVRNNLIIESIVLELTIEGEGFNDIFVELTSPYGTRTNFAYPTTLNVKGTSFPNDTSDDDMDGVFTTANVGGTAYAVFRQDFTSFKHWGELSGGLWAIRFYDFGVDAANIDGTPAADPEPAAPNIHELGVFGIPGSEFRSVKTVESFRFQIYGTESGMGAFMGCNPFDTSCPPDLNADGIVDSQDLILFINWYLAGDLKADMNGDGMIDFLDLMAYRSIYRPGFCTIGGGPPPVGGGRPMGGGGTDDTNPSSRPI